MTLETNCNASCLAMELAHRDRPLSSERQRREVETSGPSPQFCITFSDVNSPLPLKCNKLQNLNLGQPATHSKSDAPAGLGEQRRPGENDSARPGWENTLGPVMLDQAGSRDGSDCHPLLASTTISSYFFF